jgi:hypothetical protein
MEQSECSPKELSDETSGSNSSYYSSSKPSLSPSSGSPIECNFIYSFIYSCIIMLISSLENPFLEGEPFEPGVFLIAISKFIVLLDLN